MVQFNTPTIHNINIKDFLEMFEKEYAFLYFSNDNVIGFDEAVDRGDEFIKAYPQFVSEFARYRGDYLSSDREVAAFIFALSDLIR